MKRLLCFLFAISSAPFTANAQPKLDEIRSPWRTYIVVSSHMPRDQLISLARDAGMAKAVMVFNGFPGDGKGNTSIFADAQKQFADLNQECCEKNQHPAWSIEPKIAERFHLTSAPSFVIAHTTSTNKGDFSVVAGDFDLPNALKYFAQKSAIAAVRRYAAITYQQAFSAP